MILGRKQRISLEKRDILRDKEQILVERMHDFREILSIDFSFYRSKHFSGEKMRF